jgi:hypothetical protein
MSTEPAAAAPDLIDPTTGEVIDPNDTDALIASFDRCTTAVRTLGETLSSLRVRLAELASRSDPSGTRKTLRVAGCERIAVVTLPDESWDQSKLKEAWNSFPALRDRYLRIGTVNVQAVPYKQLLGTSGEPSLETFKQMLQSANRGRMGLPAVKVEK